MSYILEALQKSERERDLGKVKTLSTLQHEPQLPGTLLWRAVEISDRGPGLSADRILSLNDS